MAPTTTYFSNLVPPGVFPPASIRWKYYSVATPPSTDEFVVPWQPGTPSGVLVPCSWLVTDIFFRIENPSGSAQSTLQIARYTGTGGFSISNYVNDVAVVIPATLNECVGRPYTSATIDNPLVNSGDKLQPVISLGTGASLVSFFVVFVQNTGLT